MTRQLPTGTFCRGGLRPPVFDADYAADSNTIDDRRFGPPNSIQVKSLVIASLRDGHARLAARNRNKICVNCGCAPLMYESSRNHKYIVCRDERPVASTARENLALGGEAKKRIPKKMTEQTHFNAPGND